MAARLGIGDAAPHFSLAAAVSSRETGLPADAGRVLVLIFHDANSTHVVEPVNSAVRLARYEAEKVLVASVVNLRNVPGMMRGMVNRIMSQAYVSAADAVPASLEPSEYVVILPDWDGKVTRRYGVRSGPAVVVVDQEGEVAAFERDGDFAGSVSELLPYLIPPPSL